MVRRSLSRAASPVRAEVLPTAGFVLGDKPLPEWLAMLAAHFKSFGHERADLVGRELSDMARDARLASTPGQPLSVDQFEERRSCIRAERDATPWPGHGGWADRVAYLPADAEVEF